DEGFIPRAPARVMMLLEPISHLLAGRLPVFVEQRLGRDYETGTTEAALRPVMGNPGDLEGMKVPGCAHAFDGGNGGVVRHILYAQGTRADHYAVQNDRAGPALSLAAPDLGSREEEVFSEDVCQGGIGVSECRPFYAVHIEHLLDHGLPFRLIVKENRLRFGGLTALS